MAGRVFGRPVPDIVRHIETELADFESSGSKEDRALAENLRIDDRVSEDRADCFFERCNSSSTNVQIALGEHQRKSSGVEFQKQSLNCNNLVYEPGQLDEPRLPLQTEFVTIQLLFPELRKELSGWLRGNDSDDIGSATDVVDQWLRAFEGMDPAAEVKTGIAEAHRRLLSRQLDERRRGKKPCFDRIVWVGREDKFGQHREAGPGRWLEVFGLGHLLQYAMSRRHEQTEDWLLLLSYRMCWTIALARPTVLDAGLHPWHFPTPAHLPAREGGRTMVIGDAQVRGVEPIAEFVHNERRIEIDDVQGVFRLDRDDVTSLDLERTRNRHREWLTEWFEEYQS